MIHAYCIIFVFQLLSLTGAMESSIVGGKVAKPHSRPYMASLQIRESRDHKCGGMLIREDFVLTAAHCKIPEQMTVVLGAHNIKKKEKSQQRIEAEYIPHPKYKEFDNDIMLLKLKKKATLNKYVKTIGLPKKDEEIQANIECDVAGWGKTGRKDKPSKVLKETTEKIQDSAKCKNIWDTYFDRKQMICTTFTKKKRGICQGDSGGPLICNTKLQGITAFTYRNVCDDSNYPHVFTKIKFFLPWIEKVMQGSGDVV
ncbi:granzyme B-like [Thunnus thynnus]|uniref:granzyme B-like n=1 Tax=Thunnus thynnus TaxID=8237 RepID=UPI003527AA50